MTIAKKEKPGCRPHRITIRFSTIEYEKLKLGSKHTTAKKLSEYLRSLLFDRPVTVYTRSQSLDEGVAQLVQMKNALAAVGNNFNQVVRKLNGSTHQSDLPYWASEAVRQQSQLLAQVQLIQEFFNQITAKWLRG